MDGGGLQTFLCDPMHRLRSSGYTLSGIYSDDLSWSLRTNFSVTYTIPHTNPWVSAGVHTLGKKVLAAFLVVIHQTNEYTRKDGQLYYNLSHSDLQNKGFIG